MSVLTLARTFTLGLAVAFGTTIALPALAQDEPAPAEGAAPAAPDTGLSMGQAPADGVGSTYVKEAFGAWELRCVRTEAGNDPCQLYQLLKDAEGNSVAEIGMFTLPEGGQAVAGATVIAPLETLLTAGLRLGVDEAQPKAYPFTFCSPIGCVARVGFTAEEVAAFKAGDKAVMTIVPAAAPDKTVVLDVSLQGFTAGYDATAAANAATEAANAAAEPAAEPQE